MKKSLLHIAAAALVLATSASANVSCPPPFCDLAVPVPAGLTVPDPNIRVIVPDAYDPNGSKRYPVLYLLHGAGDFYKTWSQNTDVATLTRGLDVIVVMPSSGGTCTGCGEAGWYSDWFDGSRQWESFHIGVLVPWIDGNFATLGDGHRAVAGLSMGGFGAMSYAARHPGFFQAAASFSGAVDINWGFPVNGVVFTALHGALGTPDDRVWGNQIVNRDNWVAHNPTDRAADLAGVALFIATGQGLPIGAHDDPAGLQNPSSAGGYAVEQGVWQMNVSFIAHLDAAGVPHTDLLYTGGSHSWPYWQDDLHWALPQILNVIQ